MRCVLLALVLAMPCTALAGDSEEAAASAAAGQAIYEQTCIACHGADGEGTLPGVKDLSAADGPLAKSDEQLLTSIINGYQAPGSPLGMPPKGGNPLLTKSEIQTVLNYLRSAFGGEDD